MKDFIEYTLRNLWKIILLTIGYALCFTGNIYIISNALAKAFRQCLPNVSDKTACIILIVLILVFGISLYADIASRTEKHTEEKVNDVSDV